MDGLSRKEKLALWRAARQAPQQGAGGAGAGKGKEVPDGVLAARPGAGNKRAPSRVSKEGPKRKPFQVDTRSVREAGERRVAPGTPIHSLKKRLKRTAEANKPAPTATAATAAATTAGGSGLVPTARAQAKAKAAAAARVPGHVNALTRSLDSARTKEVSDYLKSQISEANMLLEIAGVDAARTLLADLLSCTDAARGVGELALYWAARAKLEEDVGVYREARHLLDEGEAYITMPTQQKVMAKVVAAFEVRMNDREEVEVARLLENSVGSLSLNDSATNSNSPASSAPFRYDPNEVSVDDDLGTAESAIKNLNFSTIAREGGGSATSTRTRTGVSPDWMRADSEEPFTAFSGALSGGGGSGAGGGGGSMSGVIYSDDDSDLSVSDIDQRVIARAEEFAAEEEARKARMEAAAEESCLESDDGGDDVVVERAIEGNAHPARDDKNEELQRSQGAAPAAAAVPARNRKPSVDESKEDGSRNPKSNTESSGDSVGDGVGASSSSSMVMPPPPPQPATMAMASVGPRKRKDTPHPKLPPKRNTPRCGKEAGKELSPGSFIAQVEAKGKDGKRTLTPVRRSRRISGVSKDSTPALVRKEMEAML
ncbi:unnamed protein product [Pylaiella littoralis]